MKIKAHSSIIGETGYNNHSRNFFAALNKLHEVKVRNYTVGKSWKGYNKTPHEGEMYLSKKQKDMLCEQVLWIGDGKRKDFPIYSYDESFVPDVNITLDPMDHYMFHDNHKGYNIGYNVWETTEYPKAFFNLIHKYDQFWVPTKWQKDNLVKQGYPQDKVKIVPEGIDPEVFKPAAKKPADKFTFLLFGKWEYRKATEEIVSAFLEVFKDHNDVELIASIDNAYKFETGKMIEEKLKHLKLTGNNIKLLHFPPASEYLDHLQQGDVFISCARGEGWNLPLIEAMACGIPSVYSNWGAQLEFAEGKGSPVKIDKEIPAANPETPDLVGNYCEPDWADFRKVLLDSYVNNKALKEKALVDSLIIREKFTWENASKIADVHLGKLVKKDKILYICPHLSTGGLPQYALRQVEAFNKDYGVYLVEYDSISVSYNVQKDKIKALLGSRYSCLDEDKSSILKLISTIKPQIIHFQEIPENFMSGDIAREIFSLDRAYKIVCTTHSSQTEPEHIVYAPDKFVLVSEWSMQQFSKRLGLKVDLEVWEYPVENLRTISKQDAQKSLGLDGDFKHVLKVGLFTPGKNQKEIIEVARSLVNEKIKFHFVGNLAPNFEYYWRPLIDSLPKNCVIWNERSDVERFYQAADLFCFVSNFELNPLVIKEALSYDLKVIMRKLDTYLDSYDNNKMVSYIEDLKEDIKDAVGLRSNDLYRKMSDVYSTTNLSAAGLAKKRDLIKVNFQEGCSVSINGESHNEYRVNIKESGKEIYTSKIKSNHWTKINRKYFGNYSADIFLEDKLIKSESLSLKGKNVKINIDSHSLGDNLAWIPQIDKFQKLHGCNVFVQSNFKSLFEKAYPNLNFFDVFGDCHASYLLGYYFGEDWSNHTPVNPKTVPLCRVASDILGMDYEELKPKLTFPKKVHDKKYVCIAVQSTAQAKYWNNPEGWESVIKYLNSRGYEVWCIDKFNSFGAKGLINLIPKGAVDKTGDVSLEERMAQIDGADFFIGLSSGLSWLAWALNKPVILISGFTGEFNEFYTPHRVFNEKVCNSCWNDLSCTFDASNWLWCPRGKKFECSSKITPEMVMEKINLINI
jgi:autotransporter strand-loop-strand O-heptosyltransferase